MSLTIDPQSESYLPTIKTQNTSPLLLQRAVSQSMQHRSGHGNHAVRPPPTAGDSRIDKVK